MQLSKGKTTQKNCYGLAVLFWNLSICFSEIDEKSRPITFKIIIDWKFFYFENYSIFLRVWVNE